MCAKFSTIVITNNDLARGVRDLWITIQSHCLRFARFATFSWIFIFAYVVVNVLALSRIMFVLAEIRTPCFRTIVLHGYEFMLNLNKNCWSYYSFLGCHVLLVTRYTTTWIKSNIILILYDFLKIWNISKLYWKTQNSRKVFNLFLFKSFWIMWYIQYTNIIQTLSNK